MTEAYGQRAGPALWCLRARALAPTASPPRFHTETQPSSWQKHRPDGLKNLVRHVRSLCFSVSVASGVFASMMVSVAKQRGMMAGLVQEPQLLSTKP